MRLRVGTPRGQDCQWMKFNVCDSVALAATATFCISFWQDSAAVRWHTQSCRSVALQRTTQGRLGGRGKAMESWRISLRDTVWATRSCKSGLRSVLLQSYYSQAQLWPSTRKTASPTEGRHRSHRANTRRCRLAYREHHRHKAFGHRSRSRFERSQTAIAPGCRAASERVAENSEVRRSRTTSSRVTLLAHVTSRPAAPSVLLTTK